MPLDQHRELEQLRTESDVEEEANSHTYLLKNFRVAKCERQRFIIFSVMFGIIGFIYSFMRIIKDTYVVVRQDPICILYLKVFYILPISFFAVLLINYMLSNRTISKILTIFTLFFTVLFFIFGLIILLEEHIFFDPLRMRTHLDTFKLDARGLGFLRPFLLTVNQPLATLIYITAEMWGSLILSYLFLSFLNETCTRRQHSRFLPALFIVTNISLLLSAIVTTLFFNIRSKLTYEQNKFLMASIFCIQGLMGVVILYCKYLLEQRVITKPIFRAARNNRDSTVRVSAESQKNKAAPGFWESIEIMSKSKFLLAMSTIVFFHSLTYNILESVHKNGVKHGAHIAGVEKGRYAGKFSNIDQYVTSIVVIFLNLTSFSNLIERKGWLFVALISPLVAGVSIVIILGSAIYNAGSDGLSIALFNRIFGGAGQMVKFENFLGTFCLAAMKIFKFTAFDVAKERISMRIEARYRPKFKSIYDGIFNKVGKSGGAIYGIFISSLLSDIDLRGMSPVSTAFMVPSIIIWLFAVFYLSKSYNKSITEHTDIDIDLAKVEEAEKLLEEDKEEAVLPASKCK